MIYLKPSAGLCNRMRAVDSAIHLANAIGQDLHVYWVTGTDLNSPYNALFEPLEESFITMHACRYRPGMFLKTHRKWYKVFRTLGIFEHAFAAHETERLKKYLDTASDAQDLIIESHARFYHTGSNTMGRFRPVDALQQRIDQRKAAFDPYTIGVHVRRTDSRKSIALSPDDAFITRMEEELTLEPRTQFYLATDSPDVKKRFIKQFGDRILTTDFQVSRNSQSGIEEAVVELYALAATSKILGSYWSSYSSTAAEIGNISLVTVRI